MNLRKKQTILQTAIFVLAFFTLLSGGMAYAQEQTGNSSISEEAWQKFVEVVSDPAMMELIKKRESTSISLKESFDRGDAGITWEEFQNHPRRAFTDEEVTGLQKAAEERKKVVEHGPAMSDSFGNPTGSNTFDYSTALWGDILLLHEGWVVWGYYRHAGMYDKDRVPPLDPIIEASSDAGIVLYASEYKFQHYDQQVGFKIQPGFGAVAIQANLNARSHLYKPYSWDFWHKERTDTFYCSSLLWRAYYDAGMDIDYDGGGLVTPDDIARSPNLRVWQTAN